jgi:uncharacterized protein
LKASLWAFILSVFLGALVKAQQPTFPTATNIPATTNATELAELRAKAEKGGAAAQYELGLSYGRAQNSGEAIKWFRKAADQGYAPAQNLIGVDYEVGLFVPQDYTEAFKWLSKSAAQGNAIGEVGLGYLYSTGQGVPQDYAEALKWIRKAIDQGDASGQYVLGCFYQNGQGVAQDYGEALKWYKKAADQSFAGAASAIGILYDSGQGVAQNYGEAMKWYRQDAQLGFSNAQYNIGLLYFYGKGIPKDNGEALIWFRKAAEQGFAPAEWYVGVSYYYGYGVAQDYGEAVKWYRLAADQGNVQAQVNLGGSYEQGTGVPQDYGEAVKWYRKAADQGEAMGQNNVGICYRDGHGVPQDYGEAVKWFRNAADKGNAAAQENLASCYVNGSGVIKDYVQAYQWANLALAQGNMLAKQYMPNLEGLMTPQEIADGQRLARDFKPRNAGGVDPSLPNPLSTDVVPTSSGSGFFISDDGFLITAAHVVNGANQIRLVTRTSVITARFVKLDAANDLALLKAEGQFCVLPIVSSRSVKLGNTVATVGFPNVGMQGFSPKLAKGEIASLAGTEDDPRYFQISVPVQPGNSGGALVDERGNVIGVVAAKLNAATALATSGALPENVNYAVKSSFLLGFLESLPEVADKVTAPGVKERKFEDVVDSAQKATVLVLVY